MRKTMCTKVSSLLLGLCAVSLWFSKQWDLLSPFSLFPSFFRCFCSVTELNASRAPSCAAEASATLLLATEIAPFHFGNDISSPSSWTATHVNHLGTPSARSNVNGLEFSINVRVRGLSLWLLYQKVSFPRNVPCDLDLISPAFYNLKAKGKALPSVLLPESMGLVDLHHLNSCDLISEKLS